MNPLRQVAQQDGILLVTQEDITHADCHALVIDKGVRLEIILKGTEVDIRGTRGGDGVIAYHDF